MLNTIGKTVIAGAVTALGFGFSANQASADSFSVSVHTPTVSAGYSNHRGNDSGYVDVYAPPAPVYAPRPVVVPPPVVVVEPRHACSWDRVPVSRVRYDRHGHAKYYTEYVSVRLCDDYHRRYSRGGYVDYGHNTHGRAYSSHGDGHNKHGKQHYDRGGHGNSRGSDSHSNRQDNHRGRGHR